MSDPNTLWELTLVTVAPDQPQRHVVDLLNEIVAATPPAIEAGNPDVQPAIDAANACKGHTPDPMMPDCNSRAAHEQFVIGAWNDAVNPGPDPVDWGRIKDQLEHTGTGGDTPDEFQG